MIAALALLASGDVLILKETSRVQGHYVRLSDLVDLRGMADGIREELKGVYLGRAPEGEACRTISADEIRRELEVRGFGAGRFAFVGGAVDVVRGDAPVIRGKRPPAERPPATVRRGDIVRALCARFETDARALEPGIVGQEIALEYLSTRKRFRARLTGATQVEVETE